MDKRSRSVTIGLLLATAFLLATNPVVAQAAQSITGRNIKDGSITTQDIKDRSLLARDFKPGQLPKGPQGNAGARGPQGIAGARGPQGDIGDSGPQGVPGVKGDKGEQGAPGQDGAASVVETRRMKGYADNLTQVPHPSDPAPGQPGIHFFGETRTLTVTTGQIVTASARVDIYTRVMPEPGLTVEICWQHESADHPYYPDSAGGPAPTAVGTHTSVTPVVAWYMTAGTYQIGLCGASRSFEDRLDLEWTGYIQLSNSLWPS